MIRDLRHAVRLLLRSKAWTLVVVLSLALGIGANTAIFTAFNGLLLRTIPVDHPETLVRFRWIGDNDMGTSYSDYGYTEKVDGVDTGTTFPYPFYEHFRNANKTLMDLFACAPTGQVNVVVNGQAELASSLIASGNYFQLLGVRPERGRLLTPDDDRPGAPPVAVISDGYWSRRFGRDPGVVGKVLQIATTQVTVVGVTPPEFTGVQQVVTDARDLTFPVSLDPQLTDDPGQELPRLKESTTWWLQVMGRVKPGVTAEQVQGNFDGMFQQISREAWASYFGSLAPNEQSRARNQNHTKVPRLRVQSGARGVYDVPSDTFRSIFLLGVVVALVLLIVCANVANLLLSRAAARQREISVRLSMGATRWRLIRQLLTESVLLAAIGAVLGTLVAYWGRQLLPADLGSAAAIDWRILTFVAAVTIGTGILFGMAPAIRSSRINVGAMLKEGGRTMSGGRSRLGKALVIAQVATSIVLLVGAGLFLRTVNNLRRVDVGFESDNLLLVPINPVINRYEQPRIGSLYGQLLADLPHVAGIRAVTASNPALLSGGVNSTNIFVQGHAGPTDKNHINRLAVAPNFFEAMGIRVVAGRGFNDRDTTAAPKVVVINEAAAKKYFPHQNPVGQHEGQSYETTGDYEIVGVVKDAKYNSVRDAPPTTMYVPYTQSRFGRMTFELRTSADPVKAVGAVREAIHRIDPNLPILKVSTQTEQIEQRFAQERVFAQAYALFGGLAVLIASIGLFGLMSYSVVRRTNEIGIRMALGARREDVVGMVMRESLVLVAAGVAIGAAIALGAGRFVASLLFDLAPSDPATLVASAVIMIAISLIAGYLPARTASRVDPMVALRDE
jgi:predicted permease